MKLKWSHAVINVRDLPAMVDFYTDVLGFQVTDRGPLGSGGPQAVFMSQQADEHHQLALVPVRADQHQDQPGAVNHLAFRVDDFEQVTHFHQTLSAIDGINVAALSHGNTLSIYFNDPEGNGFEVFWDTPWHVAQPQMKPWDAQLGQADALAWVEENFKHEPSFEPRERYYARLAARFA